jgi:uncharacterized protein (DUF302 family)
MFARSLNGGSTLLAALALSGLVTPALVYRLAAETPADEAASDGIVEARSAYSVEETVGRITADVQKKGILLLDVVDQAALAREAGIELRPSVLVVFGNPALGTLFLRAKPEAGLDWPVRLLVFEDAEGKVWTAYTDFEWIARRHGIAGLTAEFDKAREVIASIVSAVEQ